MPCYAKTKDGTEYHYYTPDELWEIAHKYKDPEPQQEKEKEKNNENFTCNTQ